MTTDNRQHRIRPAAGHDVDTLANARVRLIRELDAGPDVASESELILKSCERGLPKETMAAPPPYPGLAHLCHEYLHADFESRSGSWREAVARFLEREPPALVAQARAETSALRNRDLSDKDLTDLFAALGSRYWPADDGTSFIIWVRELDDALQVKPDTDAV